jgi:outer membrane protein assembly factor BamC
MDSLKFWGSDDKQKTNPDRQYRIKVSESDSGSVVTVVDKNEVRVSTTTANRIIALMYEQLR